MKPIFIFLIIIFMLVSGIFWFTRLDGWKLDYGKSAVEITSAEIGQLQPNLQGKSKKMIDLAKVGDPIKVAGILRKKNGKQIIKPATVLSND